MNYTIRVKERSWFLKIFFPRWVAAFTIGRRVYFRNKINMDIVWHEVCHVCQYLENGIDRGVWKNVIVDEVARFLWKYFVSGWKQSYRKKPYEIQAYKVKDVNDLIEFFPQYEGIIRELEKELLAQQEQEKPTKLITVNLPKQLPKK